MNTFVIGDLQGCQQQASELLQQIDALSAREGRAAATILLAGDLVNRGPQSLQALRHARALGPRLQAVLGNHDLHLLARSVGVGREHVSDTIAPILAAPDRTELLDWLRQRPLAYLHEGVLLVHAGVLPQWTCEQTLALAHEVETVLRGPDWGDFLREMYGNTPAIWHDDLRGTERLRCIINGLTRLRFCSQEGEIDFLTKEGADAARPGFMPWFEVPGRKSADTTIAFGHWSTLGLLLRENLIGLDTGCVWGGKLSAVRIDDRKLLQVACPQHRVPG
ncbi:MAG: symmetrical bis(5'-nucleosyl)-tetraphosphatase [Burkholderiales bacterium]|nr:symmetrical bis(5'-nucleosyl)-tetraphosphatase [Burkholderiales bacterium]